MEIAPPTRPAAQPLPTASEAPTPTPEIAPAEVPPSRTRGTSSDSSAAEVTALADALEALEAGDAQAALDTARTARRAFPTGVLRPELLVIEIEALCKLDRPTEAKAVADAMTSSERTPLVIEKLRRSCVGH